jgi:hypothetical protein
MHYQRFVKYGHPGLAEGLRERHGNAGSKLYGIWRSIKERTSNPAAQGWKIYGARGIKMYPEWQKSYLAFKRDVGDDYKPGLSIDRIDNDGNYEPGNVRWVDRLTQTLNQRHLRSTNTSGYRGVYFSKDLQKWRAYITSNLRLS